MSGVAGRSGPPGNQNAAEGKRWTAALERSIERKGGKALPEVDDRSEFMKGVDALADDFIKTLPEQGTPGYRELGDRLDGKSHQSIDASVRGTMNVTLDNADGEA